MQTYLVVKTSVEQRNEIVAEVVSRHRSLYTALAFKKAEQNQDPTGSYAVVVREGRHPWNYVLRTDDAVCSWI